MSDGGAVRAAVERAVDAFGGLDVLVNNACSSHPDGARFEDGQEPPWYEDFEVTLHGAARRARSAAAPGGCRGPGRGRTAALEQLHEHYPLGRVGEPDDITAAVAFLAYPDASWITGVTLPVDGGLLVSNMGTGRTMAAR